jgi:hypothetical protein
MKSIVVEEQRVVSRAGALVVGCIKEAIVLAIETDTKVVLYHNALEYKIDPDTLISKVVSTNRVNR